jgi:hypothetical protein
MKGENVMLIKEPIAVYLEQDKYEALKTLAEKRQVSVDELLREGVDRLLVDETPVEDDPLWNIVGMFESDVDDLAENHDKYLAEIYEQESK